MNFWPERAMLQATSANGLVQASLVLNEYFRLYACYSLCSYALNNDEFYHYLYKNQQISSKKLLSVAELFHSLIQPNNTITMNFWPERATLQATSADGLVQASLVLNEYFRLYACYGWGHEGQRGMVESDWSTSTDTGLEEGQIKEFSMVRGECSNMQQALTGPKSGGLEKFPTGLCENHRSSSEVRTVYSIESPSSELGSPKKRQQETGKKILPRHKD
ncbi:hypothetical protein Q3G72_013152 [Acer saccharum]|nr:hypothetical protein Q3G72_013152 [Acer saccharum]